jgi:glycosyltransferase involved in cell wall biosynthesis
MPALTSPRVSIILPIFNGEKYLSDAISSLVAQTFTDFELLIIDDGSTDNSVALVQDWTTKDRRIRLIINKIPHGLPYALNLGLQEARGEFIARADCDDIHHITKLKTQIRFMALHPSIMLLGTAYQPFGVNGKRSPIYHPKDPIRIAWNMLTGSAFCHPSVIFRKEVISKIGTYPFVASEDYAFFSAIVHRWPTANLRMVALDYREHSHSSSITHRDSIAKSSLQTSMKNISSYLGDGGDAETLYNLLVRRYLPLQKFFTVTHMCYTIAKKMQASYHLSSMDFSVLKLKLHILKVLLGVQIRTVLGLPPIGQPPR